MQPVLRDAKKNCNVDVFLVWPGHDSSKKKLGLKIDLPMESQRHHDRNMVVVLDPHSISHTGTPPHTMLCLLWGPLPFLPSCLLYIQSCLVFCFCSASLPFIKVENLLSNSVKSSVLVKCDETISHKIVPNSFSK